MIFSEFYKNPRSPLSKLRHSQSQMAQQLPTATPDWVNAEHGDLLSKDRPKQKEAVRRYLEGKIKNDWEFPWPQQSPEDILRHGALTTELTIEPETNGGVLHDEELVHDETREDDGYKVDEDSDAEERLDNDGDENNDHSDDDAQSVYSVISEDNTHWTPRLEWTSDLSDGELDDMAAIPIGSPDSTRSPFHASVMARRDRRRRQLREEMSWNDGLACFEARRNAWTGAKVARVRAKPPSSLPSSPRSPRRFFFRRSMSGSPPNTMTSLQPANGEGSGLTSEASSLAKDGGERDLHAKCSRDTSASLQSSQFYPVETLLPIPQPLLPPNSPFRATITPAIYLNLYEKVILHNLQPSCPINLADMLRSCVAGWKRDGEWPPRPALPIVDPVFARRQKRASVASNGDGASKTARRMSFGLLGRDKEKDKEKEEESRTGKGFRRSLQRAFGLSPPPAGTFNPPEKA